MSASTKKKYVTQEINELVLPEAPNFVAKIVNGRGNNLHEVEAPSGERFLVSMPTKFRKNVWVKRGDYVLCTPIAEGDKVKAEISHILYKEHIKYIKSRNLWPQHFVDNIEPQGQQLDDDFLPTSSDSDSSSRDSSNDESGYEEKRRGESECGAKVYKKVSS